MIKTINTHSKAETGNTKNTKWLILKKLRVGKITRQIREDLKKSKSCVLGHIRDLRNAGLITSQGGQTIKLSQKAYTISPQEFKKMFYLGGVRDVGAFPLENERGLLRYHNVSFSVDILGRPSQIPQGSRAVQLRNNIFYCKSYENGSVKYHNNKAILCLFEIYGAEPEECALKSLEVLENLKAEIVAEGFILDSLFICNSQHIANEFNALAEFIGKKFGACVLVSSDDDGGERLSVDFSKGFAELETENKYKCLEDFKKMQTFCKGVLSLDERQIREFFYK